MITLISNVCKPEQGGVGRYSYEVIRRAKERQGFTVLDSSDLFGETATQKLFFIVAQRRKFLKMNRLSFGDVNHFLQVEIFYKVARGRHIVTFHNPPPFAKHNSYEQIRKDLLSMSTSLLFYTRYRAALRHADLIVANSEFTREGVVEQGFDDDKVIVSFGGVSDDLQVTTKLSERNNTIGYVGSFAFHKRVGRLLAEMSSCAGSSLRRYRFELYGTKGIQLEDLKRRYGNNAQLQFCGALSTDRLASVMNSFKALVMPSKWESFGLPIIEAVACGTPAFVYDDAEITPEVRKYTIEIGDVSQIPEELERLDEEDMIHMSRRVRDEFSWDTHFEVLTKAYGDP